VYGLVVNTKCQSFSSLVSPLYRPAKTSNAGAQGPLTQLFLVRASMKSGV